MLAKNLYGIDRFSIKNYCIIELHRTGFLGIFRCYLGKNGA